MEPTFTRTFVVSHDKRHPKDVQLLDGDVPCYSLTGSGRKVAKMTKVVEDGSHVALAEVEWHPIDKDRIRFPGNAEWQQVKTAWRHYDVTKDKERFVDSFEGSDGRTYIWHLRGELKVLTVDSHTGPVVAKHVLHRPYGGTLQLTPDAYDAGDMLFVTFLCSEGHRARGKPAWYYSWMGLSLVS